MNRISKAFNKNHKALIAYITVGYPDIHATLDTASVLIESGCDMLELGIPFSDPMADGVTIQKASYQALLNGITVHNCLETAAQIRKKADIPLVFMGYLNPFLKYGAGKFAVDCSSAGIDGLIIPDLPYGELPDFTRLIAKHNIEIIHFLAPNSAEERIVRVAQDSQGFIYIVSVTGVTGIRSSFSTGVEQIITRTKMATHAPVCIGFGISNSEQAVEAARMADGIIIGSKIVQLMEHSMGNYQKVGEFVREIRQVIDKI
jgi:tryptophan synthase alpha chain